MGSGLSSGAISARSGVIAGSHGTGLGGVNGKGLISLLSGAKRGDESVVSDWDLRPPPTAMVRGAESDLWSLR